MTIPTTPDSAHLSTLALERLVTHDGKLADDVPDHLARCGVCRERHARIAAEHARFVAAVDLPRRIDELLRAARGAERPRRTWLAGALGIATAAAIVLLLVVPQRGGDRSLDGRRKGGDALDVLRRTPSGAVGLLGWDDTVHPGDAIMFRVTLAGDGYVGIVGIDAAQVVTAYAPAGDELEPIAGGAPVLLEHNGSVILDETLGPERIVLIVCPTPRPVADVIAQARAALGRVSGDPRRLGAVSSCRETALLVHKVPR